MDTSPLNRAAVLSAVQANGLALQHLPPHLRADREVVLLAVRRNGLSLAHASSELRADTEVPQVRVRLRVRANRHRGATG